MRPVEKGSLSIDREYYIESTTRESFIQQTKLCKIVLKVGTKKVFEMISVCRVP